MGAVRGVDLVMVVSMLAGAPAIAGTEAVHVPKAMDETAIITRRNGES